MRLLDLFCGAGGAATGYRRAGFDEIVGVDVARQRRYPFEFVQGCAFEYFAECGHQFDVVHASPPCQAFVSLARAPWIPDGSPKQHKDLLTPTLVMLRDWGRPWVVENVMTAPMGATVVLCGSSFGLKVRRHRKFLSNVMIPSIRCRHVEQGTPIGVVW